MASVKVAVRVRPINQREIDLESRCIIQMEGKKTRITNLKMPEQTSEGDMAREAFKVKDFTYDFSFWSFNKADVHYVSQEQVFKCLGLDVIANAYAGYNACVFAYGQTGSGKTYTMMGYQDDRGLIPRICEGLFSRMTDESTSYRVEVSYLEIYNEKVRDLLKYSTNSKVTHSLRVREHPKDGPYVQDLSKHIVNNYGDIEELMIRGNNNRTTASTNMNDTSSRSHAIFTLVFTQANFSKDMPSEMNSKVHLVDLAGSERANATGATGQRLKEGSSINKSLVTLGNVISLLAEKGGKSKTFIPYRDSTLTWLLKDSLGGNSKTVMVATISPADVNYGEILSTLRYANRAKDIINKPTVNEDPNVKLIRELRAEIARLKALLGGHIDGISTPRVQEKLHENEARVKVLTEEWAGKWTEAANVLQQEKTLALRKEGFGVVLDSDLPHLIGIDDDIISTGIMLYHLKEGRTTIGRTDAQVPPDIVLAGLEVEQEHCIIVNNCGVVTLLPLEGALCTINGVNVQDETQLTQGAVILLGKTNIFRFNHPAEAAKMKEELKACNLSVSRTSLLSQSMTDLSIYKSHENLLSLGLDFEQMHREELEKLEEKRQQIEELEERYRQGEEQRLVKQQSLERELEEKSAELEHMQQEAEKIQREAEMAHLAAKKENAMWKRKSMDLEKQVLELEVERDKGKARAAISGKGSIAPFSKEVSEEEEHSDKGEITRQVEEDLSLLSEREAQHIEEAKALKEKLSKELNTLIAEQLEKKEELQRKIEELNRKEESQEEQLEEAKDVLATKKTAIEEERQKELQLIAAEKETIGLLRQEIGVAQRKGVLEGIESSVRLGEREAEIRQRLGDIRDREEQLPKAYLEKEKALEDRKVMQLAEFDRRIQDVEEDEQRLQEREQAHRQRAAAGEFRTEAEREEHKLQGEAIEREKKQLEENLKVLMEEEEEMTRKMQEEAEQLEKEKQEENKKLEKDKSDLIDIRQAQLDKLEDEIEERNHGLEDRESKVQEAEASLLDLEDQHQIYVSKVTDQQKVLQTGRQLLETELDELEQEQSRAIREVQDRQEQMNSETAVVLEEIQEQRKRLPTLKEELEKRQVMNGDGLQKTTTGHGDDFDQTMAVKAQELEEIEKRVVKIRQELEDKKKRLEEERDSELDKIEFEKLKLQEMEHQERINNLVEQEVKRRLFEEKVQREKQWRIDRLKDKQEREKEIDRLKKIHDRELRQLKAKYEKNNGNLLAQAVPSKSNPYVTVMSPGMNSGIPEIRVRNASDSSGSSNKVNSRINMAATVDVTIPTYRLSGHGADSHYEYEVKIVLGDESWTIYRRYSRFRDLHQRAKKKIPEVAALAFPPKKLFSRSEKVVSDRQRSLEHYLINFVEVCRQSPSSSLQAAKNPYVSKQFLCECEPFFKKGIFETTKHGTT